MCVCVCVCVCVIQCLGILARTTLAAAILVFSYENDVEC